MTVQQTTNDFLSLFDYDTLTSNQKDLYNQIGVHSVNVESLNNVKRLFDVVLLCSENLLTAYKAGESKYQCSKSRKKDLEIRMMFLNDSLSNKSMFENRLSSYINLIIENNCINIFNCFKRSYMTNVTYRLCYKKRPYKLLKRIVKRSNRWDYLHQIVNKDLVVIETTKEHIERLKSNDSIDIDKALKIQLKLTKRKFEI